MTYDTFKALYEVQEAIGNLIDVTTKNEEDNELLTKLIPLADTIGEKLGVKDNHWLEQPVLLEDAWTEYIKY